MNRPHMVLERPPVTTLHATAVRTEAGVIAHHRQRDAVAVIGQRGRQKGEVRRDVAEGSADPARSGQDRIARARH